VRRERGFTLTELAVVLTVVSLLLLSLMYTLQAQTEQRAREDTLRRLEEAKQLLVSFALVHGRLPCPASGASNGDELPAGGGTCTSPLSGFLPARTIGFQPIDADGYAYDAWGNRIRYALALNAGNPTGGSGCTPAIPAFSDALNFKTNGIACAPVNLVVCDASLNTAPAATPSVPPSCGTWAMAGHARPVTNQRTVVAIVHSPGKNFAVNPAPGADELENLDNDGVFVWHEPRPAGAQGGEYDDLMVWIPAGVLYGRLVAAGVLP
jgi:prepilin-type N-terminal cleavage/methylation domain-containing protein